MRKTLLTLTIVILHGLMASSAIWAGEKSLDEVYDDLDEAIEHSDEYLQKKKEQIEGLKRRVEKAQNGQDMLTMQLDLYEAYEGFSIAQATECLNSGKQTARKMLRNDTERNINILLGYQYAAGGFYAEALAVLDSINANTLSAKTLVNYWYTRSFTYCELASHTNNPELALIYKQKADQLCTNYYAKADKSSAQYYQIRLSQLILEKKADEAFGLCSQWKQTIKKESKEYAMMAFYTSECWRLKKNTEKQRYWLAISAISNIKNAVMNNPALCILTEMISKEEDNERSHLYEEQVWQYTTAYGANTLLQKASPMITSVSNDYRNRLASKSGKLVTMTIILGVLVSILLVVLLALLRCWKQLSAVDNKQRTVTSQLASLSTQLQETRQESDRAKHQLDNTNKVKDEFIAYLLAFCSSYISKMDSYRQDVNKHLKGNKLKELQKMVSSTHLTDEETKELFSKFDEVFLKLYPTFVEEFNALLLPEHHQKLGPGHSLSTDMRMAALIRLGIDDSASISEFMRLSPNTVYNYRARMKSKALGNREELEDRIKEIGL